MWNIGNCMTLELLVSRTTSERSLSFSLSHHDKRDYIKAFYRPPCAMCVWPTRRIWLREYVQSIVKTSNTKLSRGSHIPPHYTPHCRRPREVRLSSSFFSSSICLESAEHKLKLYERRSFSVVIFVTKPNINTHEKWPHLCSRAYLSSFAVAIRPLWAQSKQILFRISFVTFGVCLNTHSVVICQSVSDECMCVCVYGFVAAIRARPLNITNLSSVAHVPAMRVRPICSSFIWIGFFFREFGLKLNLNG